jgi:endoglucanase
MDYILGRNAMNNSYVTGYGTTYSQNQHSRWFAHQLDADLPSPPPGTLAGGPNRSIQDPLAQQTFTTGCADQLCYLDDIQSWSTNEMTVNWNSSLAWVASFVADQSQLEAVSSVGPTQNDLLPIVLTGGGLVLVTLVGGLVLRGRGKKKG